MKIEALTLIIKSYCYVTRLKFLEHKTNETAFSRALFQITKTKINLN